MSFIFLCICIGLPWHIQAQDFYKSPEFVAGNLTFSWNPKYEDSKCYEVLITRNTTTEDWRRTNDTKLTIGDVMLYDRIKIVVRTHRSKGYNDNEMEYRVHKVKTKIEDTVNISWTAAFIPVSGNYYVYHTYRENRSIFRILITKGRFEVKTVLTRHAYLTKPVNSTNIIIEIRDITLDDAGYYNSGTSSEAAWSGGGVVLVVNGRPSKPHISGNFTVEINKHITLRCSSNSTSVPDYYSKLVTLSYTWFVNERKIDRETRETLKLYVTRDYKYNRYSCTATEEDMESERSDQVHINLQYGPDEITFEPNPSIQKNQLFTIREGETIGPYQCIVDCNPPCNITWEYMDANGYRQSIPQSRNMLQQHVNRTIKSYFCVAVWKSQVIKKKEITLYVKYLDKPVLYRNNYTNSGPTWTVNEHMPLRVACFVDGNPIPKIRLFKGHKELTMDTNKLKWANYTATHCEDTDNYTCEGSSDEFSSNNQTVEVNITCNLRIDESGPLQTIFSSTSGNNVKVALAIPVIANPPPQASDITLMGPNDHQIRSTVSQREVVYKQWINASVPINDHSNFGYYVIKYRNKIIHNITINAQDRPQHPLNFMAYSYDSGYVNMTWTSGFNGGSEQFFILRMRDDTDWKIIANLTDPGKGGTVHFEHGPLTPGQEIVYRLESCNIINCSIQSVEMKVNVKDISKASLTGTSEEFYAAIGVSAGVSILIVVLVVVLVILIRRKNEKKNIKDNEITQDGTEMYAVVDKSKTSNNKMKDKTGTSGATKDDYGYNRNSTSGLYAAVDKSLPKENKEATISTKYSTDKKEDDSHHGTETYAVVDKSITKRSGESTTKTKLVKTKKSKEKNSGKKGSFEEENVSPVGSRKTNDEGLIYIDVDFTNKPESSDTNQKPVIHGEEDRTEYTFVDFSKKAPPTPETHDKEGK